MDKKPSLDQFKNPNHGLPEQYKTNNNPGNQNPYTKDLLKGILMGSDFKNKKGIFGKQGISRSQFREKLGKAYDPRINMDRKKRLAFEKEMPIHGYGENISERDIDLHLSTLKKEKYSTPHIKDKSVINEKIKLLEKLKK